jgi:hypothetical protein
MIYLIFKILNYQASVSADMMVLPPQWACEGRNLLHLLGDNWYEVEIQYYGFQIPHITRWFSC